jgi:hypothetical protein
VAAFTAFTIPIFIKLFFVGNRFRPGPWNLGKFSVPIGGLACAFVMLMVPILCFPAVVGSQLGYGFNLYLPYHHHARSRHPSSQNAPLTAY